jgi:hypothetical protein
MNICSFFENFNPTLVVISALSTATTLLACKLFLSKPKQNKFDKVLSYILIADSKELDKILNVCVKNKNIIIPNWYTWYDLVELTDENISKEKWSSLHSRSEELSKQLNELVVKWIKNKN